MWVVYDRATGDIVATHRLSVPRDETGDHAAEMESSLVDSVARDTGRPADTLALLRIEAGTPIEGALHRVDVERGTLITLDDPRTVRRADHEERRRRGG